MTADELKAMTIRLVMAKHRLSEEQIKLADARADEALESIQRRDELASIDKDGKRTGVAPYNFVPSLTLWLEREILRRLGI